MTSRNIRKSYFELMKTEEWKSFREDVLERYKHQCWWCGDTKRLNVHHLVYKEGRLPWEYSMNDVRVYCMYCHSALHEYADIVWSECLKMDLKKLHGMAKRMLKANR